MEAQRKGELLNLRVRQIDLLARKIRLEPGETKNDDARTVTMTNEVYPLVAACVTGKQPDEFVFTRSNGKPVRDFRKVWRNVCERAGVPELLFHDLRRTGARNSRREGTDESTIMKMGGWKTASVFRRYNIIDEADLDEAAARWTRNANGERRREKLRGLHAASPPLLKHPSSDILQT